MKSNMLQGLMYAALISLGPNVSTVMAADLPLTPNKLELFSDDGTIVATVPYDDLVDLPQIEIDTSTAWTDGLTKFKGPALSVILEIANLKATDVKFSALNDYHATMPIEVVQSTFPIIAWEQDGERLSVRDKGPFWIIFPYDQLDESISEQVSGWSVWQLDTITLTVP